MSFGGIDLCACKRGFYTLRDCGRPATSACSLCSRRVCDEHLAPRIDTQVCTECAARQEEEGAVQQTAVRQTGDPFGSYEPAGSGFAREASFRATRFRFGYYQSYRYRPMYWGTYDPYWDSYGYRWYGDDDDEDDGGFDDS
jgi:hypothetical protein